MMYFLMWAVVAWGGGMSTMVLKPGAEFMTWGIMFDVIAMVPKSPWTQGEVLSLMGGSPLMVTLSNSSGAPM